MFQRVRARSEGARASCDQVSGGAETSKKTVVLNQIFIVVDQIELVTFSLLERCNYRCACLMCRTHYYSQMMLGLQRSR